MTTSKNIKSNQTHNQKGSMNSHARRLNRQMQPTWISSGASTKAMSRSWTYLCLTPRMLGPERCYGVVWASFNKSLVQICFPHFGICIQFANYAWTLASQQICLLNVLTLSGPCPIKNCQTHSSSGNTCRAICLLSPTPRRCWRHWAGCARCSCFNARPMRRKQPFRPSLFLPTMSRLGMLSCSPSQKWNEVHYEFTAQYQKCAIHAMRYMQDMLLSVQRVKSAYDTDTACFPLFLLTRVLVTIEFVSA